MPSSRLVVDGILKICIIQSLNGWVLPMTDQVLENDNVEEYPLSEDPCAWCLMPVFCKYVYRHVLRPYHVHIHDYMTSADTVQSHSNEIPTVRALWTVHHCSSCTSYVREAQKRTHSGAGQCEVCKSSTVKDKAMVHNGTTVYCCEVHNMHATCFMHIWAIVKNLIFGNGGMGDVWRGGMA